MWPGMLKNKKKYLMSCNTVFRNMSEIYSLCIMSKNKNFIWLCTLGKCKGFSFVIPVIYLNINLGIDIFYI